MKRKYLLTIFVLAICGCSENSLKPPSHKGTQLSGSAEQIPAQLRHRVVTLTPVAAERVRKILTEQPLAYLRVEVIGNGSKGFLYNLKLEETPPDANDYVDELENMRVVVDRKSALYIEGTTIDWLETSAGSGFKFDNPNAVKVEPEEAQQ